MFQSYASAQASAVLFFMKIVIIGYVIFTFIHLSTCDIVETEKLLEYKTVITSIDGVTDTTYIYDIRP
jgi:hypothetical protein